MGLRPRRLAAALLATAALVPATTPPAEAQSARRLYQRGREAIESQDWEQAERLMRQAIDVLPQADPRLRRNLPYVPYYYLGLALYHQGQCEEAVVQWDLSLSQGVVRELGELRTLQEKRAECVELGMRRSALDVARRELEEARSRQAELSRRSESGAGTEVWDEELTRLREAAAVILEEAGGVLAGDALPPLGEILEARDAIAGAAEELTAVEDEADRRLGLRVTGSLDRLRRLERRAERRLRQTSVLAPYPEPVASSRRRLRELADEAGRLDAEDAGKITDLAGRLEAALGGYEKATAMPPAWLLQAGAAYLDGRYEEVLAGLEPATPGSRREQAHRQLLLAAASFALARREGDASPRLEAARRAAAAYAATGWSVAAPERLFSEELRRFLAAAAATAGATGPAPETDAPAAVEGAPLP